MSAAAFDTLRFAKRLEATGMTAPQAEGFAEALSDVMTSELVTKSDLRSELAQIRAEMREMRAELRMEIGSVKHDILRWVVPLILGQMTLTVGILLRVG